MKRYLAEISPYGYHPSDSDSQHNLALVLMDQNRDDEAGEIFRTLLRQHPDDAIEHGLLAEVLATQGQIAEALIERAEAARLGAGQPKVDQLLEEIDELIDGNEGGGAQEDAIKLMLMIGAAFAARRTRCLPRS
ncbi:MAG: hypothetical protein JXR83_01305 [Deltaproteobacteria bacterium]|nr:hypothetical protein [Deltaproteobacteria bacterium]